MTMSATSSLWEMTLTSVSTDASRCTIGSPDARGLMKQKRYDRHGHSPQCVAMLCKKILSAYLSAIKKTIVVM
jgi:hypothetical protein